MKRTILAPCIAWVMLGLVMPLFAATNMIGNQSQNEGISVLPAPGKVTVDGKLDDWDFSGRIWVFADKSVRNRFSAEVAAMWDADAMYLAVHWKDPTPMYSTIDPKFNPEEGWRSDAVQLRLSAAGQTSWITTWYYTPAKQPVVHHAIVSGGPKRVTLYTAEGKTDLGHGVESAYRKDADGQGYVQEMRIPWGLIYANAPKAAAGQTFRMGMEFLWGEAKGSGTPVHRYADNVQPGVTTREFFWSATRSWGTAKLLAQGHVDVRQYISDESKLIGTIPIRMSLPKDAREFSLAIDDANGKRIRNLGGLDAADYVVEQRDDSVEVEVMWDGKTDLHRGGGNGRQAVTSFVEPGTYSVKGLYHNGIGAEYDMCFYNPGTPPWPTSDGSGAWGADHSAPRNVARAGDMMIVSWGFAEGGEGIIGIGPDGQKKWGEKRGGLRLAADDKYVYAVPAGWSIKNEVIIRLNRTNGAYMPFTRDGKELPFELPTTDIFGGDVPGEIVGMAAGKPGLALAMSGGRIVLLDRDSAKITKRINVPGVLAVAFSADGQLYALVGDKAASTRLDRIDPNSGTMTVISTPGLGKGVDLDVDAQGNIVIVDIGADQQLKAYSSEGKLVYTCGRKGGRPIRGEFDQQAMSHVSSVAVDQAGHAWVTENWNSPRRVSVWAKDGKLVRDYIGNTPYSASGSYLHDSDPTLAYLGPIEMKLNRADRIWKVTKILWVPDPSKGERFTIDPADHATPHRFASDASGKTHEYLYCPPYRPWNGHVLYMEREDGWAPAAAVTTVGQIGGTLNANGSIDQEKLTDEWSDLDRYDVAFWTDRNGDGIPQRREAEIARTDRPAKQFGNRGSTAIDLRNGWGGSIDRTTMTFYTSGITEIRPQGFTADGIPIWTPKTTKKLAISESGDMVPVPGEDFLLCLSRELQGIDLNSRKVQWSYPNPYPGVHGSHNATMPQPGLLIGPLKITGVARANDDAGNVLHVRGNLGQDFLFTTDGIFVGTLFQDGRLPSLALPDSEAELAGMPMEAFAGGSEPFNGWFGTQSDGVTRLTSGIPRQAAMILKVTGLENIHRLPRSTVMVSRKQLNDSRQQIESRKADEAIKPYTIVKVDKAPNVDGKAADWQGVAAVEASRQGSQQKASIRLAYDQKNLYALYEVDDVSAWMNEGRDFARLFKTGDTVDLQLGDPGSRASGVRVLAAPMGKKAAVVIMKPVDPSADAPLHKTYVSPVGSASFDRVELLTTATAGVSKTGNRYVVELAIPWSQLGITPTPGRKITGDVGFTGSDAAGTLTVSRTYWANKQTNLVSDEPSEARLLSGRSGQFVLGQ